MKSFIKKLLVLFLLFFPWFVFSKSVNSMSEEAFSQKPMVCTVTINSSEEKDVFESYLGKTLTLWS